MDFSIRSIEYANKTAAEAGLNIKYIHKNYLEFETKERYDLITMIMCDFCALSPIQRKIMLVKFKELLKPGGSILLDVYSLYAFNGREEAAVYEFNQMDSFWSPDDYYCFVNTFKYHGEKVILDKYTIVEKERTRIVYNWFQHYSIDSLRREFEENGLQISEIYSDVAGRKFNNESSEMAIVAKNE